MSVISQNETSIGEGTILLVQFNGSQGQLVLNSILSYTNKGLNEGIKSKQMSELLLHFFNQDQLTSAWSLVRTLLKKKDRPQRDKSSYVCSNQNTSLIAKQIITMVKNVRSDPQIILGSCELQVPLHFTFINKNNNDGNNASLSGVSLTPYECSVGGPQPDLGATNYGLQYANNDTEKIQQNLGKETDSEISARNISECNVSKCDSLSGVSKCYSEVSDNNSLSLNETLYSKVSCDICSSQESALDVNSYTKNDQNKMSQILEEMNKATPQSKCYEHINTELEKNNPTMQSTVKAIHMELQCISNLLHEVFKAYSSI